MSKPNIAGPPLCNCLKGYYKAGDGSCLKCPLKCESCDNPNSCLVCKEIVLYREYTAPNCPCIEGYYDLN